MSEAKAYIVGERGPEEFNREAPETGLLRREFSAKVTAAEGRTVDVKIVPYGEQIEHDDGLGGVPKGVIYREEFAPGAFDHQLNAAHRVLANCEHEEGIRGVVGHGIALLTRADGLYGSFKIHETAAGDTALVLLREGIYETVSLEALPRKAMRTAAGVIRRTRVDLLGLSFTRFGGYPGARVLALREQAAQVLVDELESVDLDPEIVERCRALGIRLPQRYEAHPDDPDTSADADTSADGTRHSTETTKSEEQVS